jgi:hypothetical protein
MHFAIALCIVSACIIRILVLKSHVESRKLQGYLTRQKDTGSLAIYRTLVKVTAQGLLNSNGLVTGFDYLYSIDQGSPCPLATLNPFGRELLLSDVFAGLKRSTRIERIL